MVTHSVCGCGSGCGGIITVIAALFVIFAPGYYAGQGQWPLGWLGAVIAYTSWAWSRSVRWSHRFSGVSSGSLTADVSFGLMGR